MTPEEYNKLHDIAASLSDDLLLAAIEILEIELEKRGLMIVIEP